MSLYSKPICMQGLELHFTRGGGGTQQKGVKSALGKSYC